MNTVGKILVICNLLIALAVGGFFVVDFTTRMNWKKGYDEIKKEMTVRDVNYQTTIATSQRLNVEAQTYKKDLNVERQKIKELDEVHKAEISGHKLQLEESEIRTKAAELNHQVALSEIDRLKEEVKGLLTSLRKREDQIVKLEDDNKTQRTNAIAARSEADRMQERNLSLVDRLRQLEEEYARVKSGAGTGETTIVRDPNQPNPPQTSVKGIIEKVDAKDRTLVQLSVGTDHGVKVNHTLEVYRTQPRAEYLGMVRIIDSHPHKSVGKLMRANLPRPPLQEGDFVAGTIGNQ